MTTAHRPSGSGPRPGGVGPVVGPALALTLLIGLLAGILAAVVAGTSAVLGVVVATAMVSCFFGFGAVVMSVVARLAPATSLLVALVTYTLQVVLVGLAFLALNRSGALESAVDARWVAGTLIVGTFGWLAGQVRASMTVRLPVYDLPDASTTQSARDGADTPDASTTQSAHDAADTPDDPGGDGSSTVSKAKEAGAR